MTDHEQKQDAALRLLAGVLTGVSKACGCDAGDLSKHINELLAPGDEVQKVEIVVQGNMDPSRVAKLTFDELQKLSSEPA